MIQGVGSDASAGTTTPCIPMHPGNTAPASGNNLFLDARQLLLAVLPELKRWTEAQATSTTHTRELQLRL